VGLDQCVSAERWRRHYLVFVSYCLVGDSEVIEVGLRAAVRILVCNDGDFVYITPLYTGFVIIDSCGFESGIWGA